jgi:hypothetical protein
MGSCCKLLLLLQSHLRLPWHAAVLLVLLLRMVCAVDGLLGRV